MQSLWLHLTAAPYFLLYGRDLVDSGYSWADVLRVYALNLLLIPVNLGGVCKSLHQAWTGRRSAFGRTPKIPGRTAAPALYIVTAVAILLYCGIESVLELLDQRWARALFLVVNALFFGYAIVHFIGLREAAKDLGINRRLISTLFWAGDFDDSASAREVETIDGVTGVAERIASGAASD
jgi:cellulose synthase (UDP-forming)